VVIPSRRGAKSLLKLSIEIATESEEAVIELLSGVFGQPASVFSDLEQQRMIASVFIPGISRAQRAQISHGLAVMRQSGLNIVSGRVQVRRIRRENWAESWKRHFKPLEISSRLLVLPSWSRRKARRGQAVVILDPGLSFGTGHHPTTAFCLEKIAAVRRQHSSQSLLDIGCGSGILSIAAAKLGYAPVVGFDFDPDAVRVARENAAVNRVHISVSREDLTRMPRRSSRQFDVICANLIYDLLIQESGRIISRVARTGTILLAGILKEQFGGVQRAYESAGLKLVAARTTKEWRAGAFQFKG
jgi:ribosomal protein L11 methyltransferase